MSNLFMNAIFCFGGISVGFILLAEKSLKKRYIKVFDKISNKIANYLKTRKGYKSLVNERDIVQKDILSLESGIEKENSNLANLTKGIETLDFRLHCSEDRPYKVGKWATIVRKEQPLSSEKKKRARQRVLENNKM